MHDNDYIVKEEVSHGLVGVVNGQKHSKLL